MRSASKEATLLTTARYPDGTKHGTMHVRFTWLMLTSDQSALKAALAEMQMLRLTTMSTAVLIVYIDSAKSLPVIINLADVGLPKASTLWFNLLPEVPRDS